MVNRILQELECIRFEPNIPHLEKEINNTIVKADILPYKNHFRLCFYIEDLPTIHQATLCLFQMETKMKEIIKIKPIFSKVSARIVKCTGYPVRVTKTSDYDIIAKLRARCLI
jgi:hypothetical protein